MQHGCRRQTTAADVDYRWLAVGISMLWSLTNIDYAGAQNRPIAAVEIVAQAPGKVVHAQPVGQAPAIDGDVLGDPAWASVTPVSGFVQNAPNEGQPATERTEIWVAFTDDTVYFGVVCYD